MPEQQSAAEQEKQKLRDKLEAIFTHVWNTEELQRDFTVQSFSAPYVFVVRKIDNVKGSLEFTHSPRFYYSFVPMD